ncbi:hypothetical protein H6P81_007562 [Aristolochia fimbriata]|uniref:M-phase phosphoprotein 6 n=1 Tax=Aristolochia fimbriata TaxID=158543 RepID=A0AAV7F0U0_ARIFI|nr:hypothetical protein H6P81_007562 [Aristolochia fimbriata]
MAKRELSSTLRSLKFMQRAAQREEKAKAEQEAKAEVQVVLTQEKKKCLVIMDGNTPVGARGRMSFQGFNPSVEKLSEEEKNARIHQQEAVSTSSGGEKDQPGRDGFSSGHPRVLDTAGTECNSDRDLKRKQPETEPGKQNTENNGQREVQRHSLPNKQKKEKLDWAVLRPPKQQNRRG